jgi:hypothetical protein
MLSLTQRIVAMPLDFRLIPTSFQIGQSVASSSLFMVGWLDSTRCAIKKIQAHKCARMKSRWPLHMGSNGIDLFLSFNGSIF